MSTAHEAETIPFWQDKERSLLVETVAELHRQRRVMQEQVGLHRVNGARAIISDVFISGFGVEVGGGDRPFPVKEGVTVSYGDIRDNTELKEHFRNDAVVQGGMIDAETFAGITPGILDFVISAHVIEHLANPLGSILEGLKRLRGGGVYVVVVPDMRHTFDRFRTPTTFEHLAADLRTGGEPSLIEAYRDHVKLVHPLYGPAIPEEQQEAEAQSLLQKRMDTHVHCWTPDTFRDHVSRVIRGIADIVFESSIENEFQIVIRKRKRSLLGMLRR